ncbi:MAG TPA: DcaP family trimeric outer membrane transporter [Pyrinomonadaceae bacterium]|nr:DcaP family trimeric outer membrane transporter [Pyrinomonadaceae bacterium]
MKFTRQAGLQKLMTPTLTIVILVLVQGRAAVAQTPSPQPSPTEVQQLKERLQQLEQTVKDLKTQITAMEATKSSSANIVQADYSTPVAKESPAAIPSTPGKSPDDEPKGESSFSIYGFAMLDAGYQFKQADPKWFDTVRPVKLPAFQDQFAPNGNAYFSVRQTRFGAKSTTPTKYGELKTIFEFELFGTGVDAGQTTFRLRHAWGELGHFGAGQYWSTFVDPDVFPNTNEYWGPNGIAWFRNVQFRWMPLKGKNSITIAAERPGASADLGQAADRIELQGVRPKFPVPDLTANVRFDRDWGHFQASGVVRRLQWVDTNNDEFDLSGHATGAGLGLTSALNFGKKDVGKFSFVYGHGMQNYMNDAPVDVGIELNPGNARTPIKGVALPVTGVMAYLDHTWNKRFASSIGYSMLNISNSDGQTADAFHRGHYASGNFLFYPVNNVMVGTELIWGRRENFLDGFKADDFHLQFSFKYNFSKEFKF